jgi:hypothetical protein
MKNWGGGGSRALVVSVLASVYLSDSNKNLVLGPDRAWHQRQTDRNITLIFESKRPFEKLRVDGSII